MAIVGLKVPTHTSATLGPVVFADLKADMALIESSNNDIETRQLAIDPIALNSSAISAAQLSAATDAQTAQAAATASQASSVAAIAASTAAEVAKTAAEAAEANAAAVVSGGTASTVPAPGLIPLARGDGSIDPLWLGAAFQYTYKTNWIGAAGQRGFGVGICPSNLPAGMVELVGTRDIKHDNYGNYQYSDGSIMIWMPAFYYMFGNGTNRALNTIDVMPFDAYPDYAAANAAGYALHRAFYDGGVIQSGVFVDKYQCSNNGGIASSIKNGNPLSTSAAHNPIGALVNAPANNYGGAILAPKSRGAAFFCNTRFIYSALAMLSLAHAQASTASTWCAWYDVAGVKNYPKGCNNNALGDTNDAAIAYVSDGYSNAGKTGSAALFSRTTHNGQNCGVADLNGNMWEVNPGITSDGTNYYILNTATRMRDVTGGNTLAADLFGATGIAALYASLGTTYGALWATGANRAIPMGSSTLQSLSEAASGNAWNAAGAGVPLTTGGSNAFGNDYLWDYKLAELCPIAGGSWTNGGTAGVWALYLDAVRDRSDAHVGFRAALYL